ncbi:MAG TPA: endonuclease/exonuclease/phosphatase family protein [Ilumatobacteraceae bacterium]|nr:endonuclease/exonuclease/phosphatase family protein [Ilumatobacteraceae bacterium]
MRRGGTRASFVDLVAWLVVAFVGLVTLTQAVGWTGTTAVAIVQSLTPYLAVVLVPVVLIAMWRRQLLIVTVASAIGFGIGVLAAPLAFPDPQPAVAERSTGLRVASLNLWWQNPEIEAVADRLTTVDVDVIVFSEYTLEHQSALEAASFASDFPHRSERTERGTTGMGVWSRFPIDERGEPTTFNDSIDLDVHGPDGDVRIVAMHLPTPITDFAAWQDELAALAHIGREAASPTLLIGDLNSTYWHPDFRHVLDAGFVDAHAADGSGFSASWPTDWWVPPFVRLDHALTAGGLVSIDVHDLDVPGSDHRGLVVTVAPAR